MIAGSGIASSGVADSPTRFSIVAYMVAQQGSYAITGQDVELLYNRVLEAQQGTYTLTGQDVDLVYVIATLTAQSGSYSLDGQDVELLYHRLLEAQQGSYTLTGFDVDLVRGLLRAKLAKISVSRSGTSATVTLENFSSGDLWNIYRAPVDSSATGTYTKVKDSHSSATFNDTGLTSGQRYKWRGAIIFADFPEQQKSRPRFSNV